MTKERGHKTHSNIYYKRRNLLVLMVVLLVVLTGMILPGRVLAMQGEQEYDKVAEVPEKYLSSSSAMAKNASQNLKTTERLRLISGQWESEVQEAKSYEMEHENYEAIVLARESMKELYDNGLYPANLSSDYDNWYSWKAASYKAVDTTFHTYSAYYWVIVFTKYDRTQSHTICMLDDGTIYMAQAFMNMDETLLKPAYEQIEKNEKKIITSEDISNLAVEDWMPYKDTDVTGMTWKALTKVEDGEESYFIVQLYDDDTRYIYTIIP